MFLTESMSKFRAGYYHVVLLVSAAANLVSKSLHPPFLSTIASLVFCAWLIGTTSLLRKLKLRRSIIRKSRVFD